MPAPGLEALRSYRDRYAAQLRVEPVERPEEDWEFRDGILTHRRTAYFDLVGRRHADGRESVLFHQAETALVGLICARVGGVDSVLLNARVEPGLHRGCQITTTVQSTPSNYRQRHGGRPTPFVDLLLDPPDSARVLHDSMQYDWGDYYTGKVKRFLFVEVAEPIAVAEPLAWVQVRDLPALLDEDFGVTSDLRVACLLLAATRSGIEPAGAPPCPGAGAGAEGAAADVVALDGLDNWRIHDRGLDEIRRRQGVSIGFFRTTTASREVDAWTQPLMRVADDLDLVLPVDGDRVGVRIAGGAGLGDVRLWHPATVRPDSLARATRVHPVATSAEGGRFYRHGLHLSLVEVGPDDVEDDTVWAGRDEVAGWALTGVATSLELRSTLSLLVRDGLLR